MHCGKIHKDRIPRKSTIRDPHHNGVDEYGCLDGNLYIRTYTSVNTYHWKRAVRIKFTPARIKALSKII